MRRVIDAVDMVQRETGLEVACSLGLLTAEQAERLAAAGVRRYNHNLEACRELFPTICTTHTYDDRVATAQLARDAGMELCCGGILGMGETARPARRLRVRARGARTVRGPDQPARPAARNAARRRQPRCRPREALQAIALFRLILPNAWLRLAGGRERVLGELQGMGLRRRRQRADRRQLPHDDRPRPRGRPRAARSARHAGCRRPGRRPLRRRRDRCARAARPAASTPVRRSSTCSRCAVSLNEAR